MIRFFRKIEARKYGVPFRYKEWYNYAAAISKKERESNVGRFIVIFDENGRYITCPKLGEYVTIKNNGELYLYKIVGFKNSNPNSDWLYDDDWINPIVEFVKKK